MDIGSFNEVPSATKSPANIRLIEARTKLNETSFTRIASSFLKRETRIKPFFKGRVQPLSRYCHRSLSRTAVKRVRDKKNAHFAKTSIFVEATADKTGASSTVCADFITIRELSCLQAVRIFPNRLDTCSRNLEELGYGY